MEIPNSESDDEVERELEEICGMPDDLDVSEDDLETDAELSAVGAGRDLSLVDILATSDSASDDESERDMSVVEPQPGTSGLQSRKPSQVSVVEDSDSDTDNDQSVHSEVEQSDDEEDDWKKSGWSQQPQTSSFDRVRLKASVFLPANTTPLAYFLKFFNIEIIDLLVTQTNLYAAQQASGRWEPVSAEEMKAFLGITILMGLKPLPSFDMYWSSDPFFHSNEIASVMTCKRFKKIREMLHLNDNQKMPSRDSNDFDKLYKVRPLVNLLNSACQKEARSTSSQSIDESMILFKGRSSLKQYMPLKPIKRGYKVWTRADSETGYVYEFDIYTGKRADKTPTIGLGAQVVKSLTQKLIDEGYHGHITFDSFFTSYGILQYLYDHGIFSTATVNSNRSDLPVLIKNFKKKKHRKKNFARGDFKWRVKKNVAFIMWQDSKMVTLLTTAFHPESDETTCQRKQHDGSNKSFTCPKAILEYTKRMGGVDRFDQKRTTYEVGRRCNKWWMRIFYFCIDLAITNAYMLYCSNTRVQNPITQLQFRLKLARSLVGNYTSTKQGLEDRSNHPSKKPKMSSYYQKIDVPDDLKYSDTGSHKLEKIPKYRRCRFCSTKANNKRSKIQCSKCKVPLCATPCFDLFHNKAKT